MVVHLPAAAIAAAAMIVPAIAHSAGRADLDAAFVATFAHPAPFMRTAQPSVYDDMSIPPKRIETGARDYEVRPERLVPLGGRAYALISFEVDRSASHSVGGEITVSYLDRTAAGWTLERLWPEVLYSGTFGQPADAGTELHRFGNDPLFIARSAYTGMGEWSEWLGVIRLSPGGPIAYHDVLAGATAPTPGSPVLSHDGNTCRNYDVHARVEPPHRNDALFSVRYDGWTAPPGALAPKAPLHLLTDYVPNRDELVMHPPVPVPTCGR